MAETVEISKFELRYESYRMKNEVVERKLFDLIRQRGIQKTLQGIDKYHEHVLLNGFKRYLSEPKGVYLSNVNRPS